jgi:hypothetical protein
MTTSRFVVTLFAFLVVGSGQKRVKSFVAAVLRTRAVYHGGHGFVSRPRDLLRPLLYYCDLVERVRASKEGSTWRTRSAVGLVAAASTRFSLQCRFYIPWPMDGQVERCVKLWGDRP